MWKPKTINLQEENMGENYGSWTTQRFIKYNKKWPRKENNNKLNYEN